MLQVRYINIVYLNFERNKIGKRSVVVGKRSRKLGAKIMPIEYLRSPLFPFDNSDDGREEIKINSNDGDAENVVGNIFDDNATIISIITHCNSHILFVPSLFFYFAIQQSPL